MSTLALKHDIAEELERISFHMVSLQKLFKLKTAHGKKMDFILQELFREVNTLSVKIEKPDLKDLALVNAKIKSFFSVSAIRYRKIYIN